MAEKKTKESPLIAQWNAVKEQYPDTLLLYRVGDFYETFGEDAVTVSKTLGIVLTRRASGSGTYTPLAGIPYHAIDNYLPKLVQAGFKVAVCDQLEDPKLTKKLVKRGVTELVTPGVAYNDNLLSQKENNFLAAVAFDESSRSDGRGAAGIAFLDISTGTFRVAQGSLDYIEVLLSDFAPKEILVERSFLEGFRRRFNTKAYVTTMDEWAFVPESCRRKLLDRFGTENLKGFGIEDLPLGITAAGAELFYMEMTCHTELGHIRSIGRIDENDFVWMDRFTVRNLEIFNSLGGPDGTSLLQVIDRCCSPMGARLLRQWLAMPLKDRAKIEARYDAVSAFLAQPEVLDAVRERIGEIGDMERIVSKAAAGRIAPREALQLARGLNAIGAVKQQLNDTPLRAQTGQLDACDDLYQLITNTILPEAAAQVGKGEVIAAGVSAELDELRRIRTDGKEILLQIQEAEKERTGIASLRIGFNNVFGYYLEVRNTFKDRVPTEWIRKQTLVGAERYITEELKQYEEKITGAEERILQLEATLYADVVRHIQELIPMLQEDAAVIARLDCLSSFADLARTNNYCRPEVNDSLALEITDGRHPVIETLMPPGEAYIANNLYINNEDRQIIILTGPNMAGKSAFLRQSALIVLLAQIGSFVPAKAARIGLVDKIFTRVGASDNISRGESTFMVEMLETATILNNLSPRSLILLDEIGRGTSTFDGMSIAWGIVEYLHGDNRPTDQRPKTLFATHYHELNELENLYKRVHNFHISVKEIDGKVIFLRKLCEGGVSHSFGIHVARLAGMPQAVVAAAERKLKELENAAEAQNGTPTATRKRPAAKPMQLSLYQLDDPLLLDIKKELKEADLNALSPLDAFDLIRELKKRIGLQ
ncbi:MAG: DNA mismatch repair protein MutS [Bacteroidales bacterium]|nr:DNA mismatch repair protein MutS [Bacteroidales bacterium]